VKFIIFYIRLRSLQRPKGAMNSYLSLLAALAALALTLDLASGTCLQSMDGRRLSRYSTPQAIFDNLLDSILSDSRVVAHARGEFARDAVGHGSLRHTSTAIQATGPPEYITVASHAHADCSRGVLKTVTYGANICLPIYNSVSNRHDFLLGVMYHWDSVHHVLTISYYSDAGCATQVATGTVLNFTNVAEGVCMPDGTSYSSSADYTTPREFGIISQ
jgi:hypothetical protein